MVELGGGIAIAGGTASLAAVVISALKNKGGLNGKYIRKDTCEASREGFKQTDAIILKKLDKIENKVDRIIEGRDYTG